MAIEDKWEQLDRIEDVGDTGTESGALGIDLVNISANHGEEAGSSGSTGQMYMGVIKEYIRARWESLRGSRQEE